MGWKWNEKAARYYDTDTGRFLSRSQALGYVEQSIAATESATDLLASYVADDMLSPGDWRLLMREEIKREYIREYMLGKGGRAQMTQADWGSIGGMLKEQYTYLDAFAEQVGEMSEAAIRSRSRMYIRSAREAYERGNARAQSGGVLELPAYPGDGQTVCLTNCKCNWRIETVTDDEGNVIGWDCFWEISPHAENCPDCEDNKGMWWPLEVRL